MATECISDLLTPTTIAYIGNCSLMVPKTRTSFYTSSFTVSVSKIWNTFPTPVKQATSLITFKRAIIDYILF